jgi:hypothetical protein
MTRGEKLANTKANMLEAKDRPKPDIYLEIFKGRRAAQSQQIRYWSRYGHELPKKRKTVCMNLPCT